MKNLRSKIQRAAFLTGCGLILPGLISCQSAPTSSSASRSAKAAREPAHDWSSHHPAKEDATLHIVSTTDLHGYLEIPAKGAIGKMSVDVMQGYFDIARRNDPHSVFLDSGDLFQGTVVSNETDGKSVVKWMNSAKYLATAVGNHDFDFGPGGGTDLVTKPGQDPLGALKARVAQSHFRYLSANICSVDEDPDQCTKSGTFDVASFVRPYIIHRVNGVRVGIIGLTTVSTPDTTLPSNVAKLRFMPLAETLERFIPEMKKHGADAIVVIAHEGGYCTDGVCRATDPLFKMIDALTPEIRAQIPLILGGHTHSYVNTKYNGVQVMINGKYGESFGYLTLQYHAADASVEVTEAKTIHFCPQVYPDTGACDKGTGTPISPTFLGEAVVPNPKPLARIAKELKKADDEEAEVVGDLITPLLNNRPESSLGELMADSFRNCFDSTCTNPVDMAFQNNGGIRVPKIDAGQVNYGEVFELDPFEDYYSLLNLTGKQVHDLVAAWWKYGSGLPQVSGLTITYSTTVTKPRTVTDGTGASITAPDPVISIETSDGAPLDEAKTYRVVMTDFLALGGSGTGPVVKGLKPDIHYDRILRDAMKDYFKAHQSGLDYSKLGGRLIQK